MSQLNTIALRDALISRVRDFALDDHFVDDPEMRDVLKDIWSGRPEHGGLGSDLWVEGAFPSMSADETMQQISERGVMDLALAAQLDRVGEFPFNRKPYTHQLESLVAAHDTRATPDEQPAIVVTAGTGAGKTESFLFPLLERLWTERPTSDGGVSAIILYPMNALVNDQVKRLDKWLAGQGRVSFFHFTSETPENAKRADDRNLPPATAARFRTRQQARGLEGRDGKPTEDGPQPQVLVTNYSMLEYMLCRPQDAVFFGTNLRVLVLDEAHIYTGNLAAEITMLLRRVQMRCGRRPEQVLHMATSATIGGGASELRPFAAKLFSKDVSLVRVIEGQRVIEPLKAQAPVTALPMALAIQLQSTPPPDEETLRNTGGSPQWTTASDEVWSRWGALLPHLASSQVVAAACAGAHFIGPILTRVLRESPALAKLQGLLWNGSNVHRIPLPDLASQLFGEVSDTTVEATRALLHLGAIARDVPSDYPLVPNRLHYLMRGPEGMMLSLQAYAAGAAFRHLSGRGWVFSAGADPASCGGDGDYPLTLVRCAESGWWGVAGRQVSGQLLPVPAKMVLGYGDDEPDSWDDEMPVLGGPSKVKFYSLDEVLGATRWLFDPSTGSYTATSGVPLWEITQCPRSGAPLQPDRVGWFSARARLQLSVVAETALAAMPVFPHASNVWKPARGRRLLVFSDSRAEAARLGPRLTRQHELQVFRAAVVSVLESVNVGGNSADLAALHEDAERVRSLLASPMITPVRRQSLQRQLASCEQDIAGYAVGGTIAQWTEFLRDSPLVNELFHASSGERHDSKDEQLEARWRINGDNIKEDLSKLLGRELARRPTWPQSGLETLGLVEVVYPQLDSLASPGATLLGTLPMEVSRRIEQVWPAYLAALLDAVRNQGCVTLGSYDDDVDYQFGGSFIGKRFAARDSYRRSLMPLIGEHVDGPQASRRNVFTREVLMAAGLSTQDATNCAKDMMQMAFETLLAGARSGLLSWLEFKDDAQTNGDQPTTALRIRFPMLGLRRPAAVYRCELTGQVWPRSVLGLYPGAATPSLQELSDEALDNDARLGRRRRELREWIGFTQGLWAEEHSAQLSPEENTRLQDLFRDGMRNILSSTTTLELGIDIGGLSAVLMGNLPPGKANYLQRAGRAGRRADGSSAVLGFSRPTPYEREVFLDFRRYLDRELRRPTVFLDRTAIVRRHANSWLLGEFFGRHFAGGHRGAMEVYGKMGAFTGVATVPRWDSRENIKPELPPASEGSVAAQFAHFLDELTNTSPSEMVVSLHSLWRDCPELEALLATPNAWRQVLSDVQREFTDAITTWRADVTSLTNAWLSVPATPPPATSVRFLRAQANAIYFQLRSLQQLTVIESLADARVLPRYGFPIGLCRLRVQIPVRDENTGRIHVREEDQFRLQRDSMLAMREYAPGSQLLAGGKIVTSRGLLKHWTGEMVASESWGLRGRFKRSSLGFFHYSTSAEPPQAPQAPAQGERISEGVMLFPKSGFCTAASDPPRHGSDFERVGKVDAFTIAFGYNSVCDAPQPGFGGIAGCTATYRHGGELLLMNGGEKGSGFAICQKCGYAESEWKSNQSGRVRLPKQFELHTPLNSTGRGRDPRFCWAADEAPVWRNHHLSARQTTHLLKLDFTRCGQLLTKVMLVTLGQALRLAAAEVLEIDAREIMALEPARDSTSGQPTGVILYDTLAGGAGHLAQLSHREYPERAREWIQRAVTLLTVPAAYPPSVREREAMRRVLTADCIEDDLEPLVALAFLEQALATWGPVEVNVLAPAGVPDEAWTLTRLVTEEPPDEFVVWYPADDVVGLTAGLHRCQRCVTKPRGNDIVILLDERAHEGITVGKWLARTVGQDEWQVRLRKRSGEAPPLIFTEAEYEALIPLAIIIPTD